MIRNRLAITAAALVFAAPFTSADDAPARTEEDILRSIKLPAGYTATIFAMPPGVGYPVSVSASPDGVLFVAVDENGSIDQKPARGRVLRCVDSDDDGKADQFTTFAEMDSPRGVIWDGPTGKGPGALYVMHPPNLTAYYDVDGDGKADAEEDIVTGLGFDLKFRGADHTTNGCRLAIDGFIYIAVGDYGYVEARGKDGTTIHCRGGGIVRVRPDGTGLEVVSRGQRNIYDVAVSPTLDLFTRDNTNDGGGWDVRLSHVPPGAHMGYPTLFKNFPEDQVKPLAELGGGSPCGALWIDEPGLQNGLYTVEWGRGAIMFHPLAEEGASWKAEQKEWLKITRPTDMDVDAAGRIFISSWEGATFTYNGPNAGYVLRLMKRGAASVIVPNLADANAEQFVAAINSPSGTLRLAAQGQILRRVRQGERPAVQGAAVAGLGRDGVAERTAWLATISQAARLANLSLDSAIDWAASTGLAESLLKMVDGTPAFATPNLEQFIFKSLADANPRIRAAAITAARRAGMASAVPQVLPLAGDADPIVAHLAVRALSEWKATLVCLTALDSSDEKVKPGALRALYGIHEMPVVDGLISRLGGANSPDLRRGILNALCRLANKDAAYVDPKVWWGTRPDTSGPVYKPERWDASDKIESALKTALNASSEEDARWLVQRMYLTKVNFPGLVELMLSKAGSDSAAKLTAVEGLFGQDDALPTEAVAALQTIATNESGTPEIRARSLRLLLRASGNGAGFPAAIAAFAPLADHELPHASLTAVFEEFTRDARHVKWIGDFAKLAEGDDVPKRTLAQTVLVNLATSALVKDKARERAEKAVETAWAKPATAATQLGVIARTGAKAYAGQVKAKLNDPNNAVAEAALFAYQKLGLSNTAPAMKPIGEMNSEMVAAMVSKGGGDAVHGKEIYLRAGCVACHTVSPDEPVKGPILSAVAKIYDRAALTESILKPNAKIAQGFESQWFDTKKGEHIEGFVTREGGDSLDVRNVAGQTVTIEKGDLKERGKRDVSMMPEGLLNGFTPAELSALLAYLESLKNS
ncbi:MAG: c-type cytochrome [Chthoniobacteraceae bacterium]